MNTRNLFESYKKILNESSLPIKDRVKEMAEADWSAGTPFSIDDLNEFIHILKDEGYNVSSKQGEELFDYYFECYDDARYGNNISINKKPEEDNNNKKSINKFINTTRFDYSEDLRPDSNKYNEIVEEKVDLHNTWILTQVKNKSNLYIIFLSTDQDEYSGCYKEAYGKFDSEIEAIKQFKNYVLKQ